MCVKILFMNKMFSLFFLVSVLSVKVSAQDGVCGSGLNVCDTKLKHRFYDGSCNNIQNPKWGSVFALYRRLIDAKYEDGISSYLRAKSGKPLPNPRLISSKLYEDKGIVDPKLTLNAMQFGQLFAHDLGNRLVVGSDQCCSSFKYANNSSRTSCDSIPIPPNDPVYSKVQWECLPYKRSTTNLEQNCSLSYKSAQQLNQFTAFLDMHPVYGTSVQQNRELRTLKNGQLKVYRMNEQDWFPNSTNPSVDCGTNPSPSYCFKSADARINQNPHLAIQNVILLREHNRVALKLSELNPHWNDEKIFQTARNILIGMFQHISMTEMIPVYINQSVLYEHGILFNTTGFVEDYDSDVDPSPFNEFSQAAFRHGHSMVAGKLKFAGKCRGLSPGLLLKYSYNNVSLLQQGNNFDLLTRGLTTQHSMASDFYHDVAVTQYLLRGRMDLGQDLKAIDIQRSRDHGLGSYNDYRVLCNLTRARNFSDFSDVMDSKYADLLGEVYEDPDDVDVTVGGNLERLNPGGLAGPTFTCIWLKQLKNIRRGDRLFYDHKDGPFTLEQLNEIRKASIPKWYCNNSKSIKKMQPNGFLVISKTNKLVPCESLPDVDLTKWKEYQI